MRTDLMTTPTDETMTPELPAVWRRTLRVAVAAIVVSLAGLALGGVSVWQQWQDVRRESAQTRWDQQVAENTRCVTQAESRAVTIETGHAQYDSDFRQIAGRLDMVDLLESIAMLFPPSEVIDAALVKIDDSRGRIQTDAVKLAADLAAFDAARPPLDPADCPPPPVGARP